MSKLLPRFDVLYENFRPGVMDRLGLGYDGCQAVNPSLVYASASGYGTSGPYAGRPGQDVLVEALTGWGAMTASPEDRPSPGGVAVADLLGAMNGAFAVASALVHRERTGEGQHVRVNLFNSALAGLAEWGFHAMNAGVAEPHRPAGHASPYTPPPYGFYKTRDGYLALSSGRQIAQLCKLLDIDDLSVDKRFSSYGARLRNRDEFIRIIEEALQRRTTQEWLDLMIPLDMFAAPVQTLGEAFGDPQALHNGMVVPLETPVGVLRFIGPPWDLSKTPASVRTAPPTHGQHTDEVLQELDITAEARRRLRDQQVI
jgi:crotonobetainyl-CoA:carnitine CoA-transferase CaiB-like acyl-CoA transferase